MSSGLAVTWWGHASTTVEIGGVRVATDPLLGDRLLHLRRFAPSPPQHAYDADLVLLSHLHHDHLHLPSLRQVASGVPILVPRGGEPLLRSVGLDRVHGVEPGEVVDVAGVRVTALPATHDHRRGWSSNVTAHPLGFRVDGAGRSFWFPGDTELRDDMTEVGHVDLALVPIGGWGPTLEDGHMDPAAGTEAARRVGATTAVPVHWGTFWPWGLRHVLRGNHHRLFTTPGQRFLDLMAQRDLHAVLPAHGERVEL